MESCVGLSATGMCEVILKSLAWREVNTDKILCQCDDGAYVMSGHFGGVRTILQEKLGRSNPYIDCFPHRLHLAVVDAINQIDLIKTFLEQAHMLYRFFQLYKFKKIYKGKHWKKLLRRNGKGITEVLEAFSTIQLKTA